LSFCFFLIWVFVIFISIRACWKTPFDCHEFVRQDVEQVRMRGCTVNKNCRSEVK
jgi:hypothetical protein